MAITLDFLIGLLHGKSLYRTDGLNALRNFVRTLPPAALNASGELQPHYVNQLIEIFRARNQRMEAKGIFYNIYQIRNITDAVYMELALALHRYTTEYNPILAARIQTPALPQSYEAWVRYSKFTGLIPEVNRYMVDVLSRYIGNPGREVFFPDFSRYAPAARMAFIAQLLAQVKPYNHETWQAYTRLAATFPAARAYITGKLKCYADDGMYSFFPGFQAFDQPGRQAFLQPLFTTAEMPAGVEGSPEPWDIPRTDLFISEAGAYYSIPQLMQNLRVFRAGAFTERDFERLAERRPTLFQQMYEHYRRHGADDVPAWFIHRHFNTINDSDLIGVELSEIPHERLYISASNFFFDVADLATHFTICHDFINPFTNERFSETEMQQLAEYPQIRELILAATLAYATQAHYPAALVDAETIERIDSAARWLDAGTLPPEDATAILTELLRYIEMLSPAQQALLKAYRFKARNHYQADPTWYRMTTFGTLIEDTANTCIHQIGAMMRSLVQDYRAMPRESSNSYELYQNRLRYLSEPTAFIRAIDQIIASLRPAAPYQENNLRKFQRRPLADFLAAQSLSAETLKCLAKLHPGYLIPANLPRLMEMRSNMMLNDRVIALLNTVYSEENARLMLKQGWEALITSVRNNTAQAIQRAMVVLRPAQDEIGNVTWRSYQLAHSEGEDPVNLEFYLRPEGDTEPALITIQPEKWINAETLNEALCICNGPAPLIFSLNSIDGLHGVHPTTREDLVVREIQAVDLNWDLLNQVFNLRRFQQHSLIDILATKGFSSEQLSLLARLHPAYLTPANLPRLLEIPQFILNEEGIAALNARCKTMDGAMRAEVHVEVNADFVTGALRDYQASQRADQERRERQVIERSAVAHPTGTERAEIPAISVHLAAAGEDMDAAADMGRIHAQRLPVREAAIDLAEARRLNRLFQVMDVNARARADLQRRITHHGGDAMLARAQRKAGKHANPSTDACLPCAFFGRTAPREKHEIWNQLQQNLQDWQRRFGS